MRCEPVDDLTNNLIEPQDRACLVPANNGMCRNSLIGQSVRKVGLAIE